MTNNQEAFFELVRAGLWPEREFNGSKVLRERSEQVRAQEFKGVDWTEVYRLAEEQSVMGLVTAGIEANTNRTGGTNIYIPQEWVLQFIGSTLQIEKQNKTMNEFVARLIEELRKKDIYAVLMKGQGIAQCYERPLWRASGDVDLLLSDTNYEKAKDVLLPLAVDTESEFKAFKHLGMTMEGGFVVELHGTMHSRLSMRVDRGIDEVQREVFYCGSVRSWNNENVQIFLPSPDCDVIFVFTHILHHYFIDGIGLRQICDWCRLLWTYREKLDKVRIEKRVREMGLMSEWRAFAALAVDYFGMPVEAMPFFNENDYQNDNLKRKAERIRKFVLESGNFGRDRKEKHIESYVGRKTMALWRKFNNFRRQFNVFPIDTVKFFCGFVMSGLDAASRRE